LPRGDLAGAIFAQSRAEAMTSFDDEVKEIVSLGRCARVKFNHMPARDFDLVVGAGGLHSKVRALTFGAEERFSRYLGYRVAAFETPDYQPRDELVYVSYGQPGLQASRFSLRTGSTLILLVMADDDPVLPATQEAQRSYVRKRVEGRGWECDRMLAALDQREDFYFDGVSQIEMPTWSQGRIVLLGDAAFCPSLLAGEGTSLAMTAAYVLAGELHRAGADVAAALARYERRLRPLMTRKQKAARRFARSFAPRSAFGLTVRNWVTKAMAIPGVANIALGASLRDDFALPDYG
jgi:2-polyprenyl-6-methoxyphenol hydroxylase-like FAD-dependent oxidoreductase